MARELAQKGKVRILAESDYYPSSAIVSCECVDVEVREKVTKALIDFQPNGAHSGGLYNWDKTEMPNGFIEAHDSDYNQLREWSYKLGLLKESP